MKTQDIAESNIWWKFEKNFHYYDNTMKNLIKNPIIFNRSEIELKPGDIFIVKGPRQVGKTVWIKQTIQKLLEKNTDPKAIFYLSCDSLTGKTRKEFSEAIKFYLNNVAIDKNPVYIFLDEITAVDEWNVELKALADKGITEKCAIVVTGSNPWKLKDKRERLPGRGVEGNERMFFPLTFREFVLQLKIIPEWLGSENINLIASLREFYKKVGEFSPVDIENKDNVIDAIRKVLPYQKELQFFFNIYLRTGGFPVSINSYLQNKYRNQNNEEKIDNEVYERYADVIRGDLREMVRSENSLREVIDVIAKQQGQSYSFSEIVEKMTIQPDHKTVTTYAELLKEALLVRTFYSYDFDKMKFRYKANKKIYFYDPFLYYSVKSWLSGKTGDAIYTETIFNDEPVSKLVEGIIGNHIVITKEKIPMQEGITFSWFYYANRREIDFIYRKNDDKYIGCEVKYQNNVSARDVDIIDRIKEYFIISKDVFSLDNISIIPVPLFLFSLKKSDGYI